MRSYCELYQPAAFWRESEQVGDAPIAALQADLEVHKRSVAEAAVNFDILPALIDAVDFHLSWVSTVDRPGPLPLALPILLSRFICTLLTPATAAIGAGRHVQMHMGAIADVVHLFTVLVSSRLISQGLAASPSPGELLAGLRAVLDSLVATCSVGLWSLGAEVVQGMDATASLLLDVPATAADPGVLARLTLVFMRQPPAAGAAARLAMTYGVMSQVNQAAFWRQLRSRASLCNLPGPEAQRTAQSWLAACGVHPESVAMGDVTDAGFEGETLHQHQEIDSLIDKCLRDMVENLRVLTAAPQLATALLDSGAGQPEAPWPSSGSTSAPLEGPPAESEPHRLSLLGMPALPNQQAAETNGSPKGRRKKLARSDFGKIRGVDPATAPQELRCAIDGKILGTPLRSPYGHLFEKETLENWVKMCGSMCPVTGQPLRIDDCSEDKVTAQQVLAWAKATKAEHRRQVQERREQRRVVAGSQDLETGALL